MLKVKSQSTHLFFLGFIILFWELLFIRWTGASVRIVAYFSNFVLISAFLGLGVGSMCSRFEFNLKKVLIPSLLLYLMSGPIVGAFFHANPQTDKEYIWIGSPLTENLGFLNFQPETQIHYLIPLSFAFLFNTFIFVVLGQWLGQLFKEKPGLRSYALEIAGSLIGIIVFSLLSWSGLSPIFWIVFGFIPILLIDPLSRRSLICNGLLALIVLPFCFLFETQFTWSPYYKIQVRPFDSIREAGSNNILKFKDNLGYTITVNNDFHQQMLNLGKEAQVHEFQRSWARLYDWPHSDDSNEVDGPVLIVGAGSGNDVSAALRNTNREVHAVEIDPVILKKGKKLHPESPYSNPRVTIINTDARSHFNNTDVRYAKVVFGFLDSHTLMSNFSSLRLDNFVYTYDALERVREILLPGGHVYLTFDSNTQWIHDRFVTMLNGAFKNKTTVYYQPQEKYADGVVYKNQKVENANQDFSSAQNIEPATDDWPFLYLRQREIPTHYVIFIAFILSLGFLSFFILPKNQRQLQLHYFFFGAGFFLIETSNVVKLALLFGSTWYVNAIVFAGILFFVLLGTILRMKITLQRRWTLWLGLFLSCLLALLVPVDSLLGFSIGLRAVAAPVVFLGPIFFASLLFADFIKNEKNLHMAYGSNLIGAMVGGASEYTSLVFGFNFLNSIALAFYGLALLVILLKKRN